MMNQQIKFLDFTYMHQPLRKLMIKEFEKFYDSHWYILGDNCTKFEKQYAEYCKTSYCVGVANGLDALVLCLKCLDIKAGDEVIVPANTYIATWLAVSIVGATPVPVEPRINTYNINPTLISEVITQHTKAILPVHLYGQPCEMDLILNIGRKHAVHVIEDNAQAHGATYQGQVTGSFGIVNATSFYPGKNLGAFGDAGAVVTNDAELAQKVRKLANHGRISKYDHDMEGFNSRLDTLQAAVLRVAHGDRAPPRGASRRSSSQITPSSKVDFSSSEKGAKLSSLARKTSPGPSSGDASTRTACLSSLRDACGSTRSRA